MPTSLRPDGTCAMSSPSTVPRPMTWPAPWPRMTRSAEDSFTATGSGWPFVGPWRERFAGAYGLISTDVTDGVLGGPEMAGVPFGPEQQPPSYGPAPPRRESAESGKG